jgi:hypothetical protein
MTALGGYHGESVEGLEATGGELRQHPELADRLRGLSRVARGCVFTGASETCPTPYPREAYKPLGTQRPEGTGNGRFRRAIWRKAGVKTATHSCASRSCRRHAIRASCATRRSCC